MPENRLSGFTNKGERRYHQRTGMKFSRSNQIT